MSLPTTYKALFSAPKSGDKATIREIPLPTPGKDQVLVKVEFASLNPGDILAIRSSFTPTFQEPALVGYEGSGTVVALGQELQTQFKVGDRVHFKGPGSLAQYLVAKTEDVFPIQGNLSFEESAAHFVNPGTVHLMALLAEKGSHKAVIHTAGASGLGRMLIRYLKHKGIKSINVVRRDDYVEELKKDGADYVLNSTHPDFWTKLKEVVNKEQATLGFDAISGEFSGKVLSAQPAGSKLYVYGALSGDPLIRNLSIGDLFQAKSVSGILLPVYVAGLTGEGEARKFHTEVHSLLPTIFKSEVQKIFKLEEFEEAIAYSQEHSSKGKVLMKPN